MAHSGANTGANLGGNLTVDEGHEIGIYVPTAELYQTAERPALSHRVQMVEDAHPPEDASCSVCQESDVNHHTPCGHWVHPGCLEPWLWQSDKCPVCRAPLPMLCSAHWIHNRPATNTTQETEERAVPPVSVPSYLRRSSIVLRIDGEQTHIHTRDVASDDNSDDGPNVFGFPFGPTSEEEDEEEEEEGDPWVDSQNDIVIHASENATINLNIGSRR